MEDGRCRGCGTALGPGDSFCRRCGRPVSETLQVTLDAEAQLEHAVVESGPRSRARALVAVALVAAVVVVVLVVLGGSDGGEAAAPTTTVPPDPASEDTVALPEPPAPDDPPPPGSPTFVGDERGPVLGEPVGATLLVHSGSDDLLLALDLDTGRVSELQPRAGPGQVARVERGLLAVTGEGPERTVLLFDGQSGSGTRLFTVPAEDGERVTPVDGSSTDPLWLVSARPGGVRVAAHRSDGTLVSERFVEGSPFGLVPSGDRLHLSLGYGFSYSISADGSVEPVRSPLLAADGGRAISWSCDTELRCDATVDGRIPLRLGRVFQAFVEPTGARALVVLAAPGNPWFVVDMDTAQATPVALPEMVSVDEVTWVPGTDWVIGCCRDGEFDAVRLSDGAHLEIEVPDLVCCPYQAFVAVPSPRSAEEG